MKYDRKPIKPLLQLTQTQSIKEIFIDLFNMERRYYLTLVDAFSKLDQAINISNRSTPKVVRASNFQFTVLLNRFHAILVQNSITC